MSEAGPAPVPGSGQEYRELWGWGRRPRSAAWVARPRLEEEAIPLERPPRGVIARGLGRSYGDAALNAGGLVVETTRLTGVRRFDPGGGLVVARAGTSLGELLRAVVPHGWFLPVMPGTHRVTLGGAIAADIHGKNHHLAGGFSAHLESFRLWAPATGLIEVTKAGSPDLFWATAGGMGLTGIIVEAELRLVPIETSRMVVSTQRAADLDGVLAALQGEGEDDDAHFRYAVAWVDLLAPGGSAGRGVVTRARHASLDDLPRRQREDPLSHSLSSWGTVPDLVPSGLLTRTALRGFNEMKFRSAPGRRCGLETFPSFFFVLDAIQSWNRLYGRRGFVQYQIAIPTGEEETLRRIVQRISAARCPAWLSVLKRLGPGQGYLSFPLEGWTLSVDMPLGKAGLGDLLDRLDELVASAGGRVYLAKDARTRPEALRQMYPRLADWCEVRDKVDPQQWFRSDLARRLELTG